MHDQGLSLASEWFEADGLGGFASGSAIGARTRRYHALLLAATTPPTGRVTLVNGLEVFIEMAGQVYPLSTQHYAPGVTHPRGDLHQATFTHEPWPRWVYRLPNGAEIEQELFVPHGHPAVALRWRWTNRPSGSEGHPARLTVRALLSGRDYHALHHENDAFRFEPRVAGERIAWQPYIGIPEVGVLSNGRYSHAPLWYRNFLYTHEAERGLDCTEDLASPGEFTWDLDRSEAVWIASAERLADSLPKVDGGALSIYAALRARERDRRRKFATPLDRAADAYFVRRGQGRTIVAGYPWFTDWGRDTFIAARGLCIANGRLDVAREILLAWSETVSEGMLPNRFPDQGDVAEFNSADASLWYVVAVHEFLAAMRQRNKRLAARDRERLTAAVGSILEGYIRGTRFGIRVDEDGLLAAGEPGVQLTWMDAKVGDWVVTPRVGKPVELQALWLNSLWIAAQWLPELGPWPTLLDGGLESFTARFWDAQRGHLHDVIDADHVPGRVDSSLRPNQVLAVGGLPLALLPRDQARQVVERIEHELLTPLGLRSLSPADPAYRARYEGGVWQRDGAYHQGTVWPWLLGPFVEAWLGVHGDSAATRLAARDRFLRPLLEHLSTAGLGHISEIADAEAPHAPRGCPFQAWSVGELLRLDRVILAEPAEPSPAIPRLKPPASVVSAR